MLVRNLTTQAVVDDTRNNSGDERLPLDVAREVAHEIHEARELASIALAARQELSSFVVWLAGMQRQHAIDNSLCGNYEAFLSVEVGSFRESCVATDSIIRDDVEAFVVNATRPRKHRATVTVPVQVETFGMQGVDSYDTAYRLRNGETPGRIDYDGARIEYGSGESVTLNYREAQDVNERYHRYGYYVERDSDY